MLVVKMKGGSPIYRRMESIEDIGDGKIKLRWDKETSLVVKREDIGVIMLSPKGGS